MQPKDVITKFERLFFKELFKEIKKSNKGIKKMVYCEDEKREKKNAEIDEEDIRVDDQPKVKKMGIDDDYQSSDEGEVEEDADATTARLGSRRQESNAYEDPEEEEIINDIEKEDGDDQPVVVNGDLVDEDHFSNPTIISNGHVEYEDRKHNVTKLYAQALSYDYDHVKNLWCKLDFWVKEENIFLVNSVFAQL